MTLTALSLLLLILNLAAGNVHIFEYWAELTVVVASTSLIGAFIAFHRPEHPIGWLFLAVSLLGGVDHFCAEYATYALLVQPGTLPAGEVAAWVRSWVWLVAYTGIGAFLVLLFPDGRLPSRHWRGFAWLIPIMTFGGSVVLAFSPGPVDGLGTIENPLGIRALGTASKGSAVELVEIFLLLPLELGAAASLWVRLRRSSNIERQQVKWLAYAAAVTVVGGVLTYAVYDITSVPRWVRWAGFLILMVGLAGQPVAVSIAIFRYRLYDINLVINRTLVYGALSVVLLVVFAAVDELLEVLFLSLLGVESLISTFVAAVAVAVLFEPLRRRIQAVVDRFVRRRIGDVETSNSQR